LSWISTPPRIFSRAAAHPRRDTQDFFSTGSAGERLVPLDAQRNFLAADARNRNSSWSEMV